MVMLLHTRGPLEASLDDGVVRAELQVLSLSVEEGRSTFDFMAGTCAKF